MRCAGQLTLSMDRPCGLGMGEMGRRMELVMGASKKSMHRPRAPMPQWACRPETARMNFIETTRPPSELQSATWSRAISSETSPTESAAIPG